MVSTDTAQARPPTKPAHDNWRALSICCGALLTGWVVLALLPWFAGLSVVAPVLGHASWHADRTALLRKLASLLACQDTMHGCSPPQQQQPPPSPGSPRHDRAPDPR